MTDNCVNCLKPADHLHHVVPKVYGGTDNPGNLVWLCVVCHSIVHEGKKLSSKVMQMAGIERAKSEGKYKGRKPSIDPAMVRQLTAEGLGPSEIAKRMGIARSSVYRFIDNYENSEPQCFYPGRKPSYTYTMFEDIKKEIPCKTITDLAKEYGLSRQAIIRMRDKPEECLSALKKWNLV